MDSDLNSYSLSKNTFPSGSERRAETITNNQNGVKKVPSLKLGEIFRTECGKIYFVCTICDIEWGTYKGMNKHINSHSYAKEQNDIEISEPLLASPEFVSIGELKPKAEITLNIKNISEDQSMAVNEPSVSVNKTSSTDRSMSSTTMKIAEIVKRESSNEPIFLKRIKTEDTTDFIDKSKSTIVKIVKLKRVKPNPRLIAIKKKMVIKADLTNCSRVPTNLENIETPPPTTIAAAVVDETLPQPRHTDQLQSCYQCEMEPEIHNPSDPRRHICLFCPIRFPNHVLFERHVMDIHKRNPSYVVCHEFHCYMCWESFTHQRNLTYHVDRHREPDLHLCSVCGSTHKTKYRLAEHMKGHDGKKIECDQCGKSFRRFSSLRQHFWLHDDPMFQCTVCSKAFKMKRYLERHMAVHDEPKFACRLCDAKFHFETVRRAHLRSRHHIM